MNSFLPWLPVTLSGLVAQLPLIAVSLLGLILCVARWRDAPAASRWTLASSLLSLFVCVASPIAQGLMMGYLQNLGYPAARTGALYGGLGFVWATLRAISIGFLLLGVYSGRALTSGVQVFPPSVGFPSAPTV